MTTFFCDAYRDVPSPDNPRAYLVHELRRVKLGLLSDPSDPDLREEIARLEAELRELDQKGDTP
jgi:hypothetical protein